MTDHPILPEDFAALQKFVAQWAIPTMGGRDRARLDSSPLDRAEFYDVAGKLAPAALDYLDDRTLADFMPGDRALMDLMLSLAHVALAVELQGGDEHIHARGARMMPIVRGHADPMGAGR